MRLSATLFKRGSTYYMKWVDPGTGRWRRLSLKTTRRREAEQLKAVKEEHLRAATFGVTQERREPTPKDAWTDYVELTQKSAATYKGERISWFRFFEWHPAADLSRVSRHHVTRWREHLRNEGLAPVSVNTHLANCSAVWTHLRRLQLTDTENPFKGVERLRTKKRETRFHEWDKVEDMLRRAKEAGDRNIVLAIVLGAMAGMRRNEITRARWEHIDWKTGKFWVAGTKNDYSAAFVPLHDRLRVELEPYKKAKGAIIARRDGRPLASNSIAMYWTEAKRRYGLSGTLHQLRHSFATHLLDLGYPIAQVARVLRHGSVRSTERYADVRGVEVSIDRF